MIRGRILPMLLLLFTALGSFNSNAQGLFNSVYPIGDNPNVGYKSGMVNEIEQPVFEANPILRLPLYNKIRERFQNGEPDAYAFYINFRSQLRMYDDNSLPVKNAVV